MAKKPTNQNAKERNPKPPKEASRKTSGAAPRKTARKAAAVVPKPLNRWRIGTLSLLQLALVVLGLISLNYLALHHYWRKDLTQDGEYSLSNATRNYLAAPLWKERDAPVQMIMAWRRTSPFYERMRALAEEYQRASNGGIELTVVDPLRSADRMEEIAAAYSLNLARDLILIDARDDDSPVTSQREDLRKILNPHIKLLLDSQIVAHEIIGGERKITGFQGEQMLTARIVESIEGRPRRMALIADKSRLGSPELSAKRKTLQDQLGFQNITLGEIRIGGAEAIPEEVEGLVIVSPRYDFSEEEIALLEDYWNRPRSAFLILLGDHAVPPRFRAFLRKNGVTPRDDRLIARSKDGWVTRARAVFTEGLPFTAELANQVTEFGGASSSLEVREGAEDLINQRINPVAVLNVVPGFWGETDFGVGEARFDEAKDHGPPLQVAACITRGAETDDRFAADTSRMVIVSNTGFLDPSHHRAENLDFLASSANWLVGRDSLAGITPRSLRIYMMPLLQAQISFINRCNLLFLPLALGLLAAFTWSSRRR